MTELELVQIDVHAATVRPLPKSLHLVLRDTWGMSGYSRVIPNTSSVSRLARNTPSLGLLPQGSAAFDLHLVLHHVPGTPGTGAGALAAGGADAGCSFAAPSVTRQRRSRS